MKNKFYKQIFFLFLILTPLLSLAHPLKPSVFDITFKKNGEFEVIVKTNLEVFLAGIKPTHKDTNDSPEAIKYNKLRELSSKQLEKLAHGFEPTLRSAILISFNNKLTQLKFDRFEIPQVGDIKVARKSLIVYSGVIPQEATEAVFNFNTKYGSSAVSIMNEGDKNKFVYWNAYSSKTPPFKLNERIKPKTPFEITKEYIIIGFEHIIPKGLDHILFVLGLFLLSQHWKPLLLQVTAFTLAHSVTLAFTILGFLNFPISIVEALIALSIVYIAVENILTKTLHSWRIFVVFFFGLLHGMGFASVLTEIGLPENALTNALISFNVGVELGQIAVIALAFAATFYFIKHELFRKVVVIPVSALIGLIGMYWFLERVGFI